MRLYSLELENYIGIYNGMGLYNIYIPFYNCTHNITIIKGDNGSGKTTILNALNPGNEPNSCFIPGRDASKTISYMMKDSIIIIKYVSSVSKNGNRSTSCYIHKKNIVTNVETDLNPNGNVTSGKELIFDILGIKPDFFTLSELSSEHRGLADMNPSDRKRFISSKLDQIEYFNSIHTKVVKKASECKGAIESINRKISDIGNTEQLNATIKSLESSMGELEDRRNLLIANIATNKQKLESLSDTDDRSIITEYGKLMDELDSNRSIVSSLIQYKNKFDSINDDFENKYMYSIAEVRTKINEYSSRLKNLQIEENQLSNHIRMNTIKNEQNGDLTLLNQINVSIQRLEENLLKYKNTFISIGFDNYDSVTQSEYDTAIKAIDRMNTEITYIRDLYNEHNILGEYANVYNTEEDSKELEKLVNEIKTIDAYRDISKQFSSIPEDCNHMNDCIFIKNIVENKKKLDMYDDKYDSMVERSNELENHIKVQKEMKEENNTTEQCQIRINHLYDSIPIDILKKFKGVEWLVEGYRSFINFIISNQQITLDTSEYLKYSNLISMIISTKEDLDRLKTQKSSIESSAKDAMHIQEEIDKDQLAYDKLRIEEDNIKQMIDDNIKLSNKLDRDYNTIKDLYEKKTQYNTSVSRVNELEVLLPKMKASFTAATTIQSYIDNDMKSLETINRDSIPLIQNELQKNRYKMVLYKEYKSDYDKYTLDYDFINKIKYYTSSTTGIQTVYMQIFMNTILDRANGLLKLLFRGEYVLQPFVINDKEFRIPCLGTGIMNDDISSMSTAQICMISTIISFIILCEGINTDSIWRYNIVKLDEIDGGLDSTNRVMFTSLLRDMMSILQFDQCVMISHNSELNMNDADVILLRNSDPTIDFSKCNVIYK